MSKTVLCPTCEKPLTWGPESPWRPFCSERCKLVDLGEWLTENHRIADPDGSVPVQAEFPTDPQG